MTESDPRRGALHDDTSPQEGDQKGGLLAQIPKRAKSDWLKTTRPSGPIFRPSFFASSFPRRGQGGGK